MPLTDLIRHFNSTDLAGDGMLYAADDGERAAAWFADLRLHSLFQPVVDLGTEEIVGHQAILVATREDGSTLDAEGAYALCPDDEAVIHFDRLVRTLHALNFLAQRRQTGGFLQLTVHLRHLLAVASKHGLVFEAILKRCGLAPVDIVLEVADVRSAAGERLSTAVASYRERGYRIALTSPSAQHFVPDVVKRSVSDPALPAPGELPLHLTGIDTAADLTLARSNGARFGQGELFGGARPDCLPTHKPRRAA
jgi:EAL domain-containing protein (putative c-di-GMP-specific phosphodiesterase class I)